MPHTIRATDYTGDLDTLREIYLIGPFATPEARDAEIARLYRLPGVSGAYDFGVSELDPASGADGTISAADVALVSDVDELGEAFLRR